MEAIGYVNVYDAGGIVEWPYEVVTTEEEQMVAAGLAASGAVTVEKAPHEQGCGCGHDHGHDRERDCDCGHDHK